MGGGWNSTSSGLYGANVEFGQIFASAYIGNPRTGRWVYYLLGGLSV